MTRPKAAAIPLRIAGRRFWLGAGVLGLIGIVAVAGSPPWNFIDFPHFWATGRTVGTPDLFDPVLRERWGNAHGMYLSPWVYPPGAAWLFVPFGIWPIEIAFWLHAATMALLVAASGLLGARIYGLDRRIGLAIAFAWTPSISSAIYGQNAPLALFLSLVAIEGLRRDDDRLAGLGAGLLLYKPTLALPLLGLLVLRLRWRALLVVAGCAVAWYLASVAAAAGDWAWPRTWLSSLSGWYVHDTAHNVVRTVSMPGLLQGLGAPSIVAWALAVAMVGLAVPRLVRAPAVEAGAGAVLVGLAVSPHALNWEGALDPSGPALEPWEETGMGSQSRRGRGWSLAACLIDARIPSAPRRSGLASWR